MNEKDKNLGKGLLALVVAVAGTAWLLDQLLRSGGDVLRVVGAATVAYGLAYTALSVWQALRPSVDPKEAGNWAIVTGCTGGLGQEFAVGLAKRGMNLLLVSRSEKKLQALAADLRAKNGVEAEILVFDFARSSSEDEAVFYGKILPEKLARSPIEGNVGLLVNNVGVGDEAPFFLEETSLLELNDMIKVNCGSTVQMSKVLLPLFADRRMGGVINVSSGSCAQPTPYLSTYSATKSFIAQFSKSVAREYAEFGVSVLCINPYYISGTGLYPASRPSLNAPAAVKVVDGALKTLGRCEMSHAYYFHEVIGFILGTLMEDKVIRVLINAVSVPLGVNGSILKVQKKARKRAERKMPEKFEALRVERETFLAKLGRR